MGLLDKARERLMGAAAAETWTAGAQSSTQVAGGTTAGTGPAPIPIINPSPQGVVDQLLDSGGAARGVVVGARHDMSDDDRPVRTRVHVRVRPRLRGGGLGEEAALTTWVGWKVAVLLEPGLEIPIALDHATSTATGIETGQLTDELKPRFDEAAQRRSGWSLETPLQGLTQAPGVIKGALTRRRAAERKVWLEPSDPAFVPIDGLTWEQYIAVTAQVDGRATNETNDALARQLGAPAGAWMSAAPQWQRRVMSNPQLSLQFGEDIAAAQRDLKGR